MLESLTQDPATGQQDAAGAGGSSAGAGPGAGAGTTTPASSSSSAAASASASASPSPASYDPTSATPYTAPKPADTEIPRTPRAAVESPSQPNSRDLMFGGGAKGVIGSIATLANSVLKGAMAGREKRKQNEDAKAQKLMTGLSRLNESAANDVHAAAQQPEINAILQKTVKDPKYKMTEEEQKTIAPFTDAVTRSNAAWHMLNKMQTQYFLGDDSGKKGKGKGKGKSGEDADANPLAMASSNDPNEKLRGMVMLSSRLGNPVQYSVREMLTKQLQELNDPTKQAGRIQGHQTLLNAQDEARYRDLISRPQRTPAEDEEVKSLAERRKQMNEYATAGRGGGGAPHFSTFDIPGSSFPDGTKDKFGQPIDPKRSYREEKVGDDVQYVPVQPKTAKVRNGWSKDAQGRTYSVLLDEKNQPVPGTENYNLLPPSGYGDTVRHGMMMFTDNDGNTWQIPTTTSTTHVAPGKGAGGGGGAAGAGAGAAASAQSTAPGAGGATTPHAGHAPAHAPATPPATTPASATANSPASPVPGAKFIGRKDSPVDKAVRASTIKAAGDLRRLTPSLDSADTYMKAITANPSSKDARKDLELMVAAVRAMNPGTVRLPDKELQLEIKAGSWAQRLGRNFAMAATGVLPDDQRQSLYQIVHDATTEAGVHAVGDWQTNMPNQPLPDHLKRFAEEATKRRAGGGGGGGTSTSIALPEAAAKQLKEGVVTTFKNKQKWTLHNGKPEQVQ